MKIVKTARYRLYQGDNMEALLRLKDNSVDSVVCDPPYGLGKEPDAYEMMKQWYKYDHYKHKSKAGFMGNSWDAFVPQPAFWKEVFRVLKPGGHVVAFFGSRTLDLGTLAIRLAGFEIRDSLMWIYGSGFPKSLDVSKAISALETNGGSSPKHLRKTRQGENYKPTGQKDYAKGRQFSSEIAHDRTETKLTKNAQRFKGWGSSLKPAHEPIVLARKPLIGTLAQNTLTHSTGGINIEGCRIAVSSGADAESFASNHNGSNRSKKGNGDKLGAYEGGWKVQKGEKVIPKGRFPANVILGHHPDCAKVCHEDCPIPIMDAQSGKSKSSGGKGEKSKGGLTGQVYGSGWRGDPGESLGDFGGASRFFYCAKTSKADRNAGLTVDLNVENRSSKVLSLKANINTSTGKIRNPTTTTKNNHPTVKPTALMQYLCRLITPKNGVVLDPFMGSGSTGKAAMLEGFRFIGMELSLDYCKIAKTRIAHAAEKAVPVKSIFDK